ncbi:MAG TPA: hypothetical protein EYP68_03910 [Candidatus Korarchaeota archaeon]|nr:hypothetical protein [Candidatus Korarchaeota archaeon]
MEASKELEYTKSTSSGSPLDEAMELMKAVVDLQVELQEAFSSLKENQIKGKKEEIPKIRAPSMLMALVSLFSPTREQEFFYRLSVTSFKILALKSFLLGTLFSALTFVGHWWYPFEFGSILVKLGNEIADFFLPAKWFLSSWLLRGFIGLSISWLLLIIQSLFIGLIVGALLKDREISVTQGSKIILTADFIHLVLLGLLSTSVLQLKSIIPNLSPLLLPILLLFAIIFPLIAKIVIIWRGIERIYGEAGFRGIISVSFLFFLNLIYYTIILG